MVLVHLMCLCMSYSACRHFYQRNIISEQLRIELAVAVLVMCLRYLRGVVPLVLGCLGRCKLLSSVTQSQSPSYYYHQSQSPSAALAPALVLCVGQRGDWTRNSKYRFNLIYHFKKL